jgi:hypothetical protein
LHFNEVLKLCRYRYLTMGAGASIDAVNAENERQMCDDLYARLNKAGGDGGLNFMELKKGFEELEAEEGIKIGVTAKKFSQFADSNDDKLVDKDEFFGMMKKVMEKGDIEQDKAATLLQAKARQRNAKAEVQEKKDQKQAATVLQSKARQKNAKKEVDAIRDSKGISGEGADTDSRIKAIFDAVDLNGNGSLNVEELKVYLGDDAESVVAEMDNIQTDGVVSFDEWTKFFKAIPADVVNTHLTQLEGIVSSKNLEEAIPPSAENNGAATKLQAVQRGKADRAAVETKKEENGAATILQSKARQKNAVKEVETKKEENGAATKLQSKARQKNAVKEVEAKRAGAGADAPATEGEAPAAEAPAPAAEADATAAEEKTA